MVMVDRMMLSLMGLGVAAAQPCRVEIVDKANGWPVPLVELVEGTYTTEFADHARPTPRYNYNQILYRLDFADLPVK